MLVPKPAAERAATGSTAVRLHACKRGRKFSGRPARSDQSPPKPDQRTDDGISDNARSIRRRTCLHWAYEAFRSLGAPKQLRPEPGTSFAEILSNNIAVLCRCLRFPDRFASQFAPAFPGGFHAGLGSSPCESDLRDRLCPEAIVALSAEDDSFLGYRLRQGDCFSDSRVCTKKAKAAPLDATPQLPQRINGCLPSDTEHVCRAR